MNTIKIFLAESGRIADLRKDFPLYQGQFQNKLLNVYVPTSIIAPALTVENANGETISNSVASTSVKIGMRYTDRDGSIKVSRAYYMRFLKTLTYQNVEYALYERKLPKEFTLYAGQGQNAPILIANVVNIQQDTTSGTPQVLSIITSQTCYLDVMASSLLDADEAVEPSELELVNASINAINATLLLKQDKEDEALQTTSKLVVGAINELNTQVTTNTDNIQQNTEDIARNRNAIDDLVAVSITAERYIGTMTGTTLPTTAELDQFVLENTTPPSLPRNADVVIFVLQIDGATDKNYKYIYSLQGWRSYEIPAMEEASNGTLGLVKGTYAIGSTNNTLVDISGGEIVNIYIKDNNGTYRDIREYINANYTSIDDIIMGDTPVGEALRALADGMGNNIVDTYLTQTLGATKQYVRDYSMPRQFNDVYYIGANGYQKTAPTTPESGVQFTATTNAVADYQLFNIELLNTADFELSAKNGYSNNIYVSASAGCVVAFRLTTQYKKAGEDWQYLNVELSSPVTFSAGDIQKVMFGNPFAYLGEDVITLTNGDLINQTLEVVVQTSDTITFNVYSNATYPSIFNLTSQSYTLAEVEQAIGKVILLGADGIVEAGRAIFTVQNADSFLEYRTNQREFLLTAELPVVGTLAEDLQVVIEFGDTVYNVYSFMQGSATPITIGDLKTITSYNTNTGYSFYAHLIFLRTSDIVGFALMPTALTPAQLQALDISDFIKFDNVSITKNASEALQAVALKDKAKIITTTNITSDFNGIVRLSQADYNTLFSTGTLTVDGVTYTYDNGTIYVTPDNALGELTLTQQNSMLVSSEVFTEHLQVMVEFETNGVHYGADFVLHPYDTAICLVSYRFGTYDSTAYLDESGKVNIAIPAGLTFTNVKAHYTLFN